MSTLIHSLDLYAPLPEEPAISVNEEIEVNATSKFEVDSDDIRYPKFNFNNLSTTGLNLLNDVNGNAIWVITADYTFYDVGWRCKQNGERVHLHHIDGNHNNWKANNLLAVHKSCHDYIHMSKSVSRKLDEMKVSRPDLTERCEAQ